METHNLIKCHSLLSGKNKKNISKYHLKILHSMQKKKTTKVVPAKSTKWHQRQASTARQQVLNMSKPI